MDLNNKFWLWSLPGAAALIETVFGRNDTRPHAPTDGL